MEDFNFKSCVVKYVPVELLYYKLVIKISALNILVIIS